VRSGFFKLVIMVLTVAGLAWAAPGQFSVQKRVGLMAGDQWEPALSADGSGHIFLLYPHYGAVPNCEDCSAPTMLLVASNDNGKTWQPPRVMLESGSGQFDPQIVVDPADRHTLYAAWLQNKKRVVMLAKSVDAGANWVFTVAVRSEVELDKPVLAVRGQRVFLGFNHEEEVWVASSQDGGRTFANARVNDDSRPGWSLLGGATVDPTGNPFLAWTSYSKAGGARGPVNLYVAKSVDAGKTWNANLLDVSAAAPGCQDEDCGEAYLGAQISLASDAGGTLYAGWTSGSKQLGPQRLYFSTSTNGGDSWLHELDNPRKAEGDGIEPEIGGRQQWNERQPVRVRGEREHDIGRRGAIGIGRDATQLAEAASPPRLYQSTKRRQRGEHRHCRGAQQRQDGARRGDEAERREHQ